MFQAELLAVNSAVLVALKDRRITECDIVSDSRSALDSIINPTCALPLAFEVRKNLSLASALGIKIQLWWVRAHVGIEGNERADQLAKEAALYKRTIADYDRFPTSFAKTEIRKRTIAEWDREYTEATQGRITKLFFPTACVAYRTIPKLKVSYWLSQVLTGHGGNGHYLHRLKLRDDAGCECSHADQTIEHIISDCPMFGAKRLQLELELGVDVKTESWPALITDKNKADKFVKFCIECIVHVARLNK